MPRRRWFIGVLTVIAACASLITSVAITTSTAIAAPGACVAPPLGTGTAGVAGSFVGITPVRLLDTRTTGTVQGVGADCVVQVPLTGTLPPTASGVAASVTVTDADQIGFVTAYPCGSPRPNASNVNIRPVVPIPNLVIAPVDGTRTLCIYSSVAANIIVDISGYFAPTGGQFHDIAPARILDGRASGTDQPADPLPAGTVVQLNLPALTGGQVPATATAAAVNLTITGAAGTGFATAYPCGHSVPLASNVNFTGGEDRAAQALVGLTAGMLCVYLSTDAYLIVDLSGWFGGVDGADVVPTTATRLVDSRIGTGGWTTPLAGGETRAFTVPQLAGGVRSAFLDVVAIGTTFPGYLTLYPCNAPLPPTSAVNFNGASMNLVTVGLSSDSTVCVYASAPADVVVDLLAVVDNPGALRALSVTPAALTTTFTSTGRDYAIPCAAGSNRVTVSAVALPGDTITIGAVSAPTQLSTSVDVLPNALIEVDVHQGVALVDQYYVRCLPPDFPVLSVSRLGKVAPGWYLMTPATFVNASHYAVIADERGVPIWYEKAGPNGAGSTAILDFKRIDATTVAWTPVLGIAYGTDPNGAYQIRSLATGLVTGTVHTVGAGFPTDQHDMIALPNGHHVVMSYEKVSGVDLTALGNHPGTTTPFTTNETVTRGVIQELDENGVVVFQWRAADHIAVTESKHPLTGLEADPTVVDIDHFNSVDVAANGDYIVSARHLDAVFRIDHTNGNIVWKLGGTTTAASLAIAGDPLGGPKGQHDARILADGSITMFDNELGTSNPSRAVRYVLSNIGGGGAPTATLDRAFSKPDLTTVGTMGSARITPEGDFVVGWGANNPLVTEVDANNNVVLVIDGPAGGSYRAVREPAASFDRTFLRTSSPG